MKDRGVKGVKLIVSDAHSGIRSAIKRHFQGTQWQRCRVHFKREMGRKVSYKKLKEQNEKLQAKYGIKGYPTIVVLNGEGKKVGELGYQEGGPSAFTAKLDGLKGK